MERAPGVGEEQGARLCGEGALAHALEQGQPEALLHLADLHAHRGLGEVELGGGAGEAPVARHRLECAQLGEGDVHDTRSS